MKNTNLTAVQNISEYFYNEETGCVDVRDNTNTDVFDIAGYLVEVLQHQAFKSFDGGLTFTGAITQLLTNEVSNNYGGNIGAVITNKANSQGTQDALVEEILSCVRQGSELGFYEEVTRQDITILFKDNAYYVVMKIIRDKSREKYTFKISENGEVFKN